MFFLSFEKNSVEASSKPKFIFIDHDKNKRRKLNYKNYL